MEILIRTELQCGSALDFEEEAGMIAFIKGELAETGEGTVIIDSGNIGWEINVPASVTGSLPPVGSTVKLHTWFQVREDGMALFGFLTKDDLDIFKMLIKVNGVGPRAAVSILSVLSPDEIRFAVLADDEKTICRAQGLGSKTARKIILELKDKLDLETAFEKKLQNVHGGTPAAPAAADARGEVVQALAALGYSSADAFRMVNSVEGASTMDTETLLREALRASI
jgi:Holliday junction DNA helicase RuvA